MVVANFLIPTEAKSSSMSICISASSDVGVTERVSHSINQVTKLFVCSSDKNCI